MCLVLRGIGSWDGILMPWGAFLCACPPAGTKVDSFRETEKSKPHFLFRVWHTFYYNECVCAYIYIVNMAFHACRGHLLHHKIVSWRPKNRQNMFRMQYFCLLCTALTNRKHELRYEEGISDGTAVDCICHAGHCSGEYFGDGERP